MSAASDKYERDVAAYMNKLAGVKAIRPTVGTDYPDVLVEYNKVKSYVEVKMSHSDNLSNPRMFYSAGRWQTTYSTPAASYAVDILNNSPQTKEFIKRLSTFTGIPLSVIKIPTTKSGLKEPGAVPLKIMKMYFDQPAVNRYIANKENQDLGRVVTEHYTIGKAEPANYMQAGDDFYRVGPADPFKLGSKVPILKGIGDFKVRIGTRSEFYEVQAEIKIKQMPDSQYSCKPGTYKRNPFSR